MFARRIGVAWLGMAAVVLLGACSSVFPTPGDSAGGGPGAVVRQPMAQRPSPAADGVEIWLLSDSYHTSLVLPLDWLEASGFHTPPSVRGEPYVNLSWGDRVAYEHERWLRPSEMLRALCVPSESVIEIIAVDYDPRWVFPKQRIYHTRVARDRGPALAAFLNHSLLPQGSESGWRVIAEPTWGRGSLILSPHSYQFPRLCNSWTAGALEACGFSFGTDARIFAGSLVRSCVQQGFERVPPLNREERKFLENYLREIGHVSDDA